MNTYNHINDCVEALMACKNIDEVHDTLDNFPRKFGEWWGIYRTLQRREFILYNDNSRWYGYRPIQSKSYGLTWCKQWLY